MSDKKKLFTELLVDLERAYAGSAHKNDMEYTYGFMDALAVVRKKIEQPAGPDPWKMAWGALLCAALAAGSGEKEETKEKKEARSDYCCCLN